MNVSFVPNIENCENMRILRKSQKKKKIEIPKVNGTFLQKIE